LIVQKLVAVYDVSHAGDPGATTYVMQVTEDECGVWIERGVMLGNHPSSLRHV
jgi:hypothetical protein